MLNQKQCQTVIKRMYDFRDKTADPNQRSQMTYANNISSVSYEEYYRRIKEMGVADRLKDDEINKYLGDRQLGERAYKKVSTFSFFIFLVGCKKNRISPS